MLVSLFVALAGTLLYAPDSTWQPELPHGGSQYSGVSVLHGVLFITQRGNSTLPPVLALGTADGKSLHQFGSDSIAVDAKSGTWGAHGIGTQMLPSGIARVFINDFTQFVLLSFDCEIGLRWACRQSLMLGTPGEQGVGTDPVQFGHLADTAIQRADRRSSHVYVSDGDGGTANRVISLNVTDASAPHAAVEWATASRYHNPHSIALHERTGTLLIADREGNATRMLRASDGVDLGSLDCGLELGRRGKPFGVRFYRDTARMLDLAFVAIMDNPQDGANQKIAVLDASGFHSAGPSASVCRVLQILVVPAMDSGPHLLAVDDSNGDVYAALVANQPRSWVLRYSLLALGDTH
jgi:hypothetical protein